MPNFTRVASPGWESHWVSLPVSSFPAVTKQEHTPVTKPGLCKRGKPPEISEEKGECNLYVKVIFLAFPEFETW